MPLSETATESKSNAVQSDRTETTLLLSEDDELEAQTDHVYEVSPRITEPCLDDPRGPTYHAVTKNPLRVGCAPPGGPSPGGSVSPPASQQEGDGGTDPLKENTKINAAGRVKPRPPDPSTKPRASWIHQSKGPKQQIQVDAVQRGTKSSERRTTRGLVPSAVTPGAEELETPVERSTSTRSPSVFLPLEPISRAVQSVLRQMRHTDGDPAAASGKHPDSAESNRDVDPPLGTAAPQPKNPVLKRNDLESGQESGRPSQPSAQNKKEPSQAGFKEGPARSSPGLTTSSPPNGDLLLSKADSPGKEGLRNVRKCSPAHSKTAVKKPVQIKNPQEGHIDSKVNVNE